MWLFLILNACNLCDAQVGNDRAAVPKLDVAVKTLNYSSKSALWPHSAFFHFNLFKYRHKNVVICVSISSLPECRV